jgi:hypothetical protein
MMRTGTSVVARILDLLGVYLGSDDDLLAPNPENPSGFWEHREIIALNEELLARFGGTWYAPPELPRGWEFDPSIRDLRERGQELIRSKFAGRPRWGWKDPRTCLTLPFWQSLVDPMRYLLCVRSPVETARSLEAMWWVQRRLSAPFEQGVQLWLTYTTRALEHTRDRRRLLLFYEDMIADSRREASRLASFVGSADALESSDIERAIDEFVQPDLRHQVAEPTKERHEAERLYLELRRHRPPAETA